MLGAQLPASAPLSSEAWMAGSRVAGQQPGCGGASGGAGMTSWTGSAVMVLQGPDLQQLEQCRRAPGHKRHHLPDAGPLDLAGLAGAVLGVGRGRRGWRPPRKTPCPCRPHSPRRSSRTARGSRRGDVLWRLLRPPETSFSGRPETLVICTLKIYRAS